MGGFANIGAPLHTLTGEKETFSWTRKSDNAFRRLKSALCSGAVLAYPQAKGRFILDIEATNTCIGAAFPKSKTVKNYCATRKELLAIMKAVDHLHKHL